VEGAARRVRVAARSLRTLGPDGETHRLELLAQAVGGGEASGAGLEGEARLVGSPYGLRAEIGDLSAAVRMELDEPFRGEAPERLS
jgi:hypothetical protein